MPDKTTIESSWLNIKNSLIQKNSQNIFFKLWFDPTDFVDVQARENGDELILSVPSNLHKAWIYNNIFDSIHSSFSQYCQKPYNIKIIIKEEGNIEKYNAAPIEVKPSTEENNTSRLQKRPQAILKPEYSFSSFVTGPSNEFAHAACYAITQSPGDTNYNPLYICGPTGMGKTHLLQAVGNYIQENSPEKRVLYISTEQFLNNFISSIRRKSMDQFKKEYRESYDILLMDDIQLLGRGENVQEEFFNTLNYLFSQKKQVVVASDRMPKNINNLENRVRTRLEWGLVADIHYPDLETRIAILKYKMELMDFKLEDNIVTYIARISKCSIRELEGNLNKVKMFYDLQGSYLELSFIKKLLANHVSEDLLTEKELLRMCAESFNLSIKDLKSRSRSKIIVSARQTAMYFLKKYLELSLVDIGRCFGGKDHATVINALKKVEKKKLENVQFNNKLKRLESEIQNLTQH